MRAGGWTPVHSHRALHTQLQALRPRGCGPHHTNEETRAPRTRCPSGIVSLSPRRNPGCPPCRGLGEVGGCYPSYYLGLPQPPPHCTVGKPGSSKQVGTPRWGAAEVRQPCPRPKCFAGRKRLCCSAGSDRFQAIRAELQRYRQPVILFKQPLLFEVAGLVIAVTTRFAIVTG